MGMAVVREAAAERVVGEAVVLWGAGAAQRVAVAVAVGALGVVAAAVVRRRAEAALVAAERVGAAAVRVAALGTAATALQAAARRAGEVRARRALVAERAV